MNVWSNGKSAIRTEKKNRTAFIRIGVIFSERRTNGTGKNEEARCAPFSRPE